MIPFDGNISYDYAMKYIAESGFEGTMMLEVNPKAKTVYEAVSNEEFHERAATAAKRLADMVEGYKCK
jgi:hypothetical protein